MNLFFTRPLLLKKKFCLVSVCILLNVTGSISFAQTQLINESFATAIPLPTGWAFQNLSSPAGTTDWLQGNTTVFTANTPPTNSFIAANYQNTSGAGTISNWLFTPEITMRNGDIFTFYTRQPVDIYPDRLEVRLSTSGPSVNAGTTSTSVGDFTNLLLEINPTLLVNAYPQTWTQFTINISGLTGPTSGRLAFRYFVTDAGPDGNNSNYIGIDDVVYTAFTGACAGPPDPGNTLSSVTDVCPTNNITLSLQNQVMGSGVTYQWQTSTDNVTWTNASATTPTFTTQQNVATWYRAEVTCATVTTASTPVQVNMTPANGCYCIPSNTDCTDGDEITNVTLLNLDNNSQCGTNGYTNYTTSGLPVPDLVQGATIPMSVTGGGGLFTEYVAVWIDFNQNGVFDDTEYTNFGSLVSGTLNQNIVIPANALTGQTRMRVRMRFNTVLPATGACLSYIYGETEDYTVNIVPCIQGVFNTQTSDVTTNCNGTTSFSVATSGSLLTYQWQTADGPGAPWTNVADGNPYSGAITNTLTLTNTPTSFDGRLYRVVINGPCTATDISAAATLNVGPLVANVIPADAAICAGGDPLLLQITNEGAPPATTNFSSGPISIAIPDNSATGVSSTIPVTIPSGSVISNLAVNLNITHTWVGDLVIVLKAPNGQIFNLDYFLSQTGNGPSAGFSNTVISSTGTTALSSGSGSYSGTFKADGFLTGNFGPAGPTGFTPTASAWNALYSVPGGDWTLAVYDGGNGDLGTITNWSLDVTFGAPATGIFSPETSLFTDAAATVPYVAGTPVSTVYASPASSTTYQVVVANALCTSAPLDIPVSVSEPLSGLAIPSDFSACSGNNSTILATLPNAVGDETYRWQVSTDGGTTWNNINDAGVYSGSSTTELALTAPSGSFNGNLYRAIATNICGSDTSTTSAFSVQPFPFVSLSASPYTRLLPNTTTTLTAHSSNPGSVYTWFRNGQVLAGETGETLEVDIDGLGEYSVHVSDVNGCGGTSQSITIIDSASNVLFIYPNPNSGEFQVRYPTQPGNNVLPRFINVYDSKGSLILTRSYLINAPYTRMDVDLKANGKGIYFVELTERTGKRIAAGRVIVY